MFQPQQTSHTNFSSYPQIPTPNLNLLFPQPVLPSDLPSEPVLHPPGTDPYVPTTSFPSIHGGFEGQPPHCEDPNVVSQNWVVKQADPVGYTTAVNSSNEKSVVSTSLIPLWSNNWMNQPLVNGVTVPKQSNLIQSMWCGVCNIDCNSKDAFEKHIAGKKHKKKLQVHNNPNTTILEASGVAAGETLGTKRQKLMEGGAAVDSVRVCTICNVACNSQVVFDKHLTGKKHAAQAGIRPPNGIANPNSILSISPVVQPQGNCTWEGGPKQTKVVQFAWCEVCDIYCNTNEVLIKHKLGKKHHKNLKELEKPKKDSSAPTATNLIIGPVENPETDKGKSVASVENPETDKGKSVASVENPETDKGKSIDSKKKKASRSQDEDLETKKRKIMESGTAAGDVRACIICNVASNSQAVLNSHLAGRKHAAMLKKQAEAGLTAAGPQVVATT